MICTGEGTLLWAISFFLNEKKNIFRLIFKSDLRNPNFVANIHILYCFFWKVTFSMSKVIFGCWVLLKQKG